MCCAKTGRHKKSGEKKNFCSLLSPIYDDKSAKSEYENFEKMFHDKFCVMFDDCYSSILTV